MPGTYKHAYSLEWRNGAVMKVFPGTSFTDCCQLPGIRSFVLSVGPWRPVMYSETLRAEQKYAGTVHSE